jgi:hypothetical protein
MATDAPKPLASYTERLPQVQRIFGLYSNRVEIEAKWTLGKDYRSTVQLADLAPQYKFLFVRNRWFKKAIMIGSLAVAAAVVFTRGDYPDWVKRNALLGWPVAGACLAMVAMTARRRRFARFFQKSGRPGLDIFDAGPDRAHFTEFVESVQKQVRRAR